MDHKKYLLELAEQHISVDARQRYLSDTSSFFNPNVFVISRAKESLRLQRSVDLLKSLGLKPIHFIGVEGADEPVVAGYEGLSAAERGCTTSHMSLVQVAAMHPNPNQFTSIYEDDIVSPLKGAALTEHLHNLERHVKEATTKGHHVRMIFQGKCLEECLCMEQIDDGLFRAVSPFCNHAYMLRNSAAREIIAAGGLQHPLFRGTITDGGFRNLIKTNQFYALVFHPALFFRMF